MKLRNLLLIVVAILAFSFTSKAADQCSGAFLNGFIKYPDGQPVQNMAVEMYHYENFGYLLKVTVYTANDGLYYYDVGSAWGCGDYIVKPISQGGTFNKKRAFYEVYSSGGYRRDYVYTP